MENGKDHIKQFSAIDIEKYHKGLLSSAEMHVMEKAAMDDPFLADALEGYGVAGVNVKDDLDDLAQRLEKRTADKKIIPISRSGSSSFNLLRAAVILLFVAGAALLVYQFGFNTKKDIAQAKTGKNEETVLNDSASQSTAGNNQTFTNDGPDTVTDKKTTHSGIFEPPKEPVHNPAEPVKTNKTEGKDGNADGYVSTERGLDIVSAPVDNNPVPKTVAPSSRSVEEKPGIAAAKQEDKKLKADEARQLKEKNEENEFSRDQAMNRNAGSTRREANVQFQASTFRGRVTDADNTGVPFANVTNLSDNNAGTYTDAKGYFNLTYPDSVLTVQVRSIGFENANVRLKNNVPTNQVILKDDRTNLNEVVLSKQTNTAQRKTYDNMKIEEPEPADGWEKYDAYLLNNLNKPADEKQIPGGIVEISLEVNKNGEPTNLKVEKSLCSSCDKEAIRLIKEGPKWKRKAKKGRTTVKIPF